jgi:hypothetical protein
MSRPKVTKITLEIEGKKDPVEIDPTKTDALFFTDQAVRNFLVPFYSTGAGSAKGVDPVSKWDTADSTGTLPAYLVKIPNCYLG